MVLATVDNRAKRNASTPNGRGRPVPAELTRKQEYLLQVAREHFIARGFGESSIDGIAAATGISKMTIYRWYGSKTDLFRAVMLKLADETVMQLHNPVSDERSLDEVLYELAWTLYELQLKPASVALTRLMIAEAIRFPEVVRNIQVLVVKRSLSVLENYFAELGRHGVLVVDDAFRLAHQFATLAVGSYRFLLIEAESEAAERERIRAAVELFLRGCRGDRQATLGDSRSKRTSRRR